MDIPVDREAVSKVVFSWHVVPEYVETILWCGLSRQVVLYIKVILYIEMGPYVI